MARATRKNSRVGALDVYDKPASDLKFARQGNVIQAVTRNPLIVADAIYPSPPSVDVALLTASTLASPITYRLSSGMWTLVGARQYGTDANGVVFAKTTGATTSYEVANWGAAFNVIGGGLVEIAFVLIGSAVRYQVEINDQLVTAQPVTQTGLTASTNYVLRIPLPTDGNVYKVRVIGTRWRIGSVRVNTTTAILPLVEPRYKIACFGASFAAQDAGWPVRLGRLAGAEMFQCAIAGSGFLADAGASLTYGATARIDALVAANPDLIILETSGNDSEGYTFAQMRDAKIAWFNQVAAALPAVRIVVTDVPPRGAGVASADYTARNLASTRAAINAVPNVNIIGYHDYIGVLNGTAAYTTGAAYSVGTRVIYNGAVWECLATVSSAPSVMLTRDWKMFGSYTGTGCSGSRTVANGVTNSTTTITSATMAFTSTDVGRFITGAGIPAGATIASVTNSTTAVLSAAATATATGVSLTINNQRGDGTRDSLLGPDNLHPAEAGALALAYQYWPDVQVDITRDTRVGVLPNAESF